MKKLLTIILFVVFNGSVAQSNILQDSPDIKWMKIENQHFEVVYPEHTSKQAQYIMQLLNYYRKKASSTYKQETKKISIILRSASADPNGFVTLAPRRSEWFMNASFTPFVGSLDWYQSLAVHEYRHVVQFDFLNRSNIKTGYFFGGETFSGLLMNIAIPNWFFEGDAVWTETVLSNAGRGRSPRFSSRLKALLTSDYNLTLDQLLAGDFTQALPNHYVYGYFFITRAIALYGEDFWYHVTARATDEPLNPYALYDAFWELSGNSFDQFYAETVNDLKENWGLNPSQVPEGKYTKISWPMWDGEKLYYLKKDLDNQWLLIEKNQKEKVLTELYISPSLTKVDLKNSKFVYPQSVPHFRWGFKNYSDLFIYDIKKQSHTRLTNNKRLYHPQFSQNGKKILAVEYDAKNHWNIVIYNLAGELLDTIPSQNQAKIVEAVWKNQEEILAITLGQLGKKKISLINIKTKTISDISPMTRNNIFALHFNGELYFEADDLGAVNIFKYNFEKEEFYKCSDEFIAAYSPATKGEKVYFVAETQNGTELRTSSECSPVLKADIFKNYLGKTASDNFTKTTPVSIEDISKLTSTSLLENNYPEYSNSLTPHSWSFISGRGLELSGTTSNNLGTLALSGYIGRNPEESTPFMGIITRYSKFYPIFSFGIEDRQRSITVSDQVYKWKELETSLQVGLPYIYQKNLYSGAHLLSFFVDQIAVGEKDILTNSYELNDDKLTGLGFSFDTSLIKNKLAQELFPRHGFEASYFYENIQTTENSEDLSYLGTYQLKFFIPGLLQHHGVRLRASGEYRPENENLYRQQNEYISSIGYSFSRGYIYEFTPRFNKYSLDYALPMFYPNWGFRDWIYFNRIYAQLFIDHTLAEFDRGDRTLNSFGMEINFNSLTFRKFSINYGLRMLKIEQDNTNQLELFVSL